jgi:aspartate ammonia-lyase
MPHPKTTASRRRAGKQEFKISTSPLKHLKSKTMRTKKAVILNDMRLGAIKMKDNNLIVKAKTDLCNSCKKNTISPYEVELCDFCADNLRYIPRIF